MGQYADDIIDQITDPWRPMCRPKRKATLPTCPKCKAMCTWLETETGWALGDGRNFHRCEEEKYHAQVMKDFD